MYALALDGAKNPCRVVSSNSGQVLLTGIASPERAERVAGTLLGSACFSGWGIRTLGLSEPHYNPMSYHNGSVWPHDNGLIALGLARYGHKQAPLKCSARCSTRLPTWTCGACRSCSAVFCAASITRRRNTRWPVLLKPGQVPPYSRCCKPRWGWRWLTRPMRLRSTGPCCRSFSTHLHLRNLRLSAAPLTCCCSGMATTSR